MPPYGAVEENERGKGGRQPSPDSAGGTEPRPTGIPFPQRGFGGTPEFKVEQGP